MSGAKTAVMISEANKIEAAERLADRDAMLETMQEENKILYRRVEFLEAELEAADRRAGRDIIRRVELLEAVVKHLEAGGVVK